MIHVSVTIKKVSLQGRPWFFLPFPSHSSFILIISVTVVPERVQRKSNIKNFQPRVISVVAPIFEHNCAYQDDPCGSQGPKHTQQKSDLQDWFLHTIWLQPPSFSIVAPEIKDKMFIRIPCEHRVIWLIFKLQSLKARDIPHFGHSLVLAEIQFDVSESSSHFLIHFLIRWHLTGSCHPSEHAKQKRWPHLKHWKHLSFEFCQKIICKS